MDQETKRNLTLRLQEILDHLQDSFFYEYALEQLKELLKEIKEGHIKNFIEPF